MAGSEDYAIVYNLNAAGIETLMGLSTLVQSFAVNFMHPIDLIRES